MVCWVWFQGLINPARIAIIASSALFDALSFCLML